MRLVLFKSNSPKVLKVNGVNRSFCSCGLTETPPYCSGKHIRTVLEDRDKVYVYDRKGAILGSVKHIVLEDGRVVSPSEVFVFTP
jgi:CDGSH-type Zn-finger protein